MTVQQNSIYAETKTLKMELLEFNEDSHYVDKDVMIFNYIVNKNKRVDISHMDVCKTLENEKISNGVVNLVKVFFDKEIVVIKLGMVDGWNSKKVIRDAIRHKQNLLING